MPENRIINKYFVATLSLISRWHKSAKGFGRQQRGEVETMGCRAAAHEGGAESKWVRASERGRDIEEGREQIYFW